MRASVSIVTELLDIGVILLKDESNVNKTMSITNDAENVCKSFSHFKEIYYIDTMGHIDQLVHENGIFLRFSKGCPYYDNFLRYVKK